MMNSQCSTSSYAALRVLVRAYWTTPGLLAPGRQAARRAPASERVSRSWNKDGRGSVSPRRERKGRPGHWEGKQEKESSTSWNSGVERRNSGTKQGRRRETVKNHRSLPPGREPSLCCSLYLLYACLENRVLQCCALKHVETSRVCRPGIESYLDANNESISISQRMHSRLRRDSSRQRERERENIPASRTKIREKLVNLQTHLTRLERINERSSGLGLVN